MCCNYNIISLIKSLSLVRLVGGSGPHEGRVEIFHNGQWGTVCSNYWDLTDARVVCYQLGFSEAISAPRYANFGEGCGQIWLDNVNCSGVETRLNQCNHRGWGIQNCYHSRDAGVICDNGK